MSDIAIRVENLSKKYQLGQTHQRADTLRDAVVNRLRSLRPTRQSPLTTHHPEEFWALRDVSFEVKKGEVVGVIGRNGAGKSTLLKILSQITEPTSGKAFINGRVGSLLEVGTGFHPELTGRENIYLNGAMLGMRRTEIEKKFDEIIAFAEIEKFLDTPVKRYSSGMYVRLAFAVAAYLEPEILLVDEVLAVGDIEFQNKCLGKMGSIASQGRTILFISHNIAAVSNLCSRTIMLQRGEIVSQGDTVSVIEDYLGYASRARKISKDLALFRPTWAKPIITSVRMLDNNGNEKNIFAMGTDVVIEMTFDTQESLGLKSPVMGVVINHSIRGVVGGINTRMSGFHPVNSDGAFPTATYRCLIKKPPLLQGHYNLDIWLGDGSDDLDTLEGYLQLTIQESDIYHTGRAPFAKMGVVFLDANWDLLQ